MTLALPTNVSVPRDWPPLAKGAFLSAIALAHRGVVYSLSWCINSRIERVRLAGELAQAETEVAMLKEELRIKDARMRRLAPTKRPHYSPPERLAILALKASRGWSNAQTAQALLISDNTIATWLNRVEQDGPEALVQLASPVNRFPDFVTLLVQQLKSTCPTFGKIRIAQMLARAGLQLSASTVKRMLENQGVPPLPDHSPSPKSESESAVSETNEAQSAHVTGKQAVPCSDVAPSTPATADAQPGPVDRSPTQIIDSASQTNAPSNRAADKHDEAGRHSITKTASRASATKTRVVTATYPNHVWHSDLTAVPTWIGFWVPWLPFAFLQFWPFCYWTLAVLDHFSRKAVMARSFRLPPSAKEVTDVLDTAVAIAGSAPKYMVTDQGQQFGEDYEHWCQARGVKPRFGAIGEHGSIALIERFNLSLKNECTRRILVPLRLDEFDNEVILYLEWYNDLRPHQSLGGRTPNEVYAAARAARDGPRLEPRDRMTCAPIPVDSAEPVVERVTNLQLVVTYFEGRKHLPIVDLRRAA